MIGTIMFAAVCFLALLFTVMAASFKVIGPNEVGLVIKKLGRKLPGENIVAFNGEAGYQADLLMPGLRFKLWPIFSIKKYPWVQISAGKIGVVIAQIGRPLPAGAKSAVYKNEFGDFVDLRNFIEKGGQKGVQRPVLRPGASLPIHPIAFLVITSGKVFGEPVDENLVASLHRDRDDGESTHSVFLTPASFGLKEKDLNVQVIEPRPIGESTEAVDVVGVITTLEGPPLDAGDIACRIGGFQDIASLEKNEKTNSDIIEILLADKNEKHDNYQNYQAFLDNGGKMGLQHDVLRYGAYVLNPFLVKVESVKMLVVQQGEVAVIKAYVGLSTEDVSGEDFKYGTIVKPGHRGIWEEPLRTGKYAINPRIYEAEIVPTYILNLSWAEQSSKAHAMDTNLSPIQAKSREGFIFKIDLQVQIHIPDKQAPRVISMVGTVRNLVEEILHPAVGNYFRDKLQGMPAIKFIEEREEVQKEAHRHIESKLSMYHVETPGTYIQDVDLPVDLIAVTKEREIANQRIETLKKQKQAEDQRIEMESSRGKADQQAKLAASEVGIQIKKNEADARTEEARGEAKYLTDIGLAKGVEPRAVGEAKADAYKKQVDALGADKTAMVAAIEQLAAAGIQLVPQILVTGGSDGGGGASNLLSTVLAAVMAEGRLVGQPEKSMGEKKN